MRQERPNGKTLYQQMVSDKKTLYRRKYMQKKTEVKRKELRPLELSPYQYMLENQNGVCAICSNVDKSGRALAIDHDHKTGFVRGLLCGSCNRGLGLFRDNPEILLKAAKYLSYGK